ncbi:FAD:protein FMN transferase [Danxiaibacter flavus]|uniref:FAD:protein FMN transferase n=1 Tax=Danxiaibacter flavus TaxID=3049108 RepID=A0ABV3ZM96_9BACT|nr:FAD:protein FMN transferase [Chitinophagaceae bacterium DXS]
MRIFLLLGILTAGYFQRETWLKKQISGFAQGTTYHITYYSGDTSITQANVDSVLNSIDSSLSIYKPYSTITRFNQSEKGTVIDAHFIKVFNKSIETYKATNGLFDITVAPLVTAWGFGAKKNNSMPDSAQIEQLKECVSSDLLKLEGNFLRKEKPCVQVDVNGIAQGYTVDVLADYFESRGITNYIIEVGGEIRVSGRKMPSGEEMKIGIESPGDDEIAPEIMQQVVKLKTGAITTSGNYRKYYESDGKRVSHLIDPRTGYSLQNEMISVTVYAKDAITADAYDNALMTMGRDSALRFVENRNDIAAYMIYKRKDGVVADTATSKFYELMKQ